MNPCPVCAICAMLSSDTTDLLFILLVPTLFKYFYFVVISFIFYFSWACMESYLPVLCPTVFSACFPLIVTQFQVLHIRFNPFEVDFCICCETRVQFNSSTHDYLASPTPCIEETAPFKCVYLVLLLKAIASVFILGLYSVSFIDASTSTTQHCTVLDIIASLRNQMCYRTRCQEFIHVSYSSKAHKTPQRREVTAAAIFINNA